MILGMSAFVYRIGLRALLSGKNKVDGLRKSVADYSELSNQYIYISSNVVKDFQNNLESLVKVQIEEFVENLKQNIIWMIVSI